MKNKMDHKGATGRVVTRYRTSYKINIFQNLYSMLYLPEYGNTTNVNPCPLLTKIAD